MYFTSIFKFELLRWQIVSMGDSFDFYHRRLDHLIDFVGCQLQKTTRVCTVTDPRLMKVHYLPLDSSLKWRSTSWILPHCKIVWPFLAFVEKPNAFCVVIQSARLTAKAGTWRACFRVPLYSGAAAKLIMTSPQVWPDRKLERQENCWQWLKFFNFLL